MLDAVHGGAKNIQITADDTDIFVLYSVFVAYFYWLHKLDIQLFMKKNDGKYIDIRKTAMALAEKCLELPSLHALTGCDSVSYPFKKGKVTAVHVLMKNSNLQLNKIGDTETPKQVMLNTGKAFFVKLYSGKLFKDMQINDLRYKLFTSKTDRTLPIKTLPPTEEALEHHILRAHLQTAVWKAADLQEPPKEPERIEHFGWKIVDGIPQSITSMVKMAPSELLKVVSCSCGTTTPCARRNCSCVSSALSCTRYCKCERGNECQNVHTTEGAESEEAYEDEDEDEDRYGYLNLCYVSTLHTS